MEGRISTKKSVSGSKKKFSMDRLELKIGNFYRSKDGHVFKCTKTDSMYSPFIYRLEPLKPSMFISARLYDIEGLRCAWAKSEGDTDILQEFRDNLYD
jgi:hypothetical protein